MERTAMSTKEFTRATVLARVREEGLKLADAAAILGVSYRHVKRLSQRFRARGAKGLIHGNVGRRSNHARPAAERAHILELVRAHYSGPAAPGPGQRFGPTLAAEHLWEDHGIVVPVPTLRRWMQQAKLWSQRRRSTWQHHVRPRRAHFGELLQLDGSFHDWFEGRGPRACLLTLIDDATGTTLARFDREETTWAAARLLRWWIARYGVPRALYADCKSVYSTPGRREQLKRGGEAVTHFGRMCTKLGIAVIAARSPEAKGRVERNHGTNQDRLVKKLRLRGIATSEAANAFLEASYLPAHNTRYTVRARSPVDFHTPPDPQLDPRDVYCLESPRVLGNDWVVRYANRGLHILPSRDAKRYCAPGVRLLVRESEAGVLRVLVRPRDGRARELAWEPVSVPVVQRTAGRHVAGPRRPLPSGGRHMGVVAPAPASAPPIPPVPRGATKVVPKPAPTHPWRQQIQAEVQRHLVIRQQREATRAGGASERSPAAGAVTEPV